MALPTVQNLKDYCRIETMAEDSLLGVLLAQAQAVVEGYVGRPITAAARTDHLRLPCDRDTLVLGSWPVDTTTLTLTDPDGDAVDTDDLLIGVNGVLRYADGSCFVAGLWIAAYSAGWNAHPDYDTKYEPILSHAILDAAADRYQRRNPAATEESAGGGVRASYGPAGLPTRVTDLLDGLRPPAVR